MGTHPVTKLRLSNQLWRAHWPALVRVLFVMLLGYGALLGLAMLWEEAFIFFPMPYPAGDWTLPPGAEDAWFKAEDGTKLHGWFLPHPKPLAVVLFCHGNAGNVTHRADVLWQFRHLTEVSILVFDYRGYGRSEGRPSEKGILADTRAARRWLANRTGTPENEIVLAGQSLGGAVAAVIAGQDGARALILENTFTCIRDMARYHYAWLPVWPFLRTRLDALEHLRRYPGPVFVAHAERDTIVPLEHGRTLFAAASGQKEFLLIPKADHNDPLPSEYYTKVKQFLQAISKNTQGKTESPQ
jgi:fermentation-respiration switch protein FrsA (DUF1100 family)